MCPFPPHFQCNMSEAYRMTVKTYSMTLYSKLHVMLFELILNK